MKCSDQFQVNSRRISLLGHFSKVKSSK
ncbi:CLUMA_CG011256, isoform A [Clunio marinus]|uniref:CLUMA_CG011256, isoform A n=1 Tax=Clunio marinus TaxID=568069 RepID=A0A1J1IHF9_9DIPT|nr:CLUMA_CG011256, isoform A [Clunio marinus]